MILGIPAALVGFLFFRISAAAAAMIMIPMVADGFIQLLTRYESTNPRRCITGFLFGYGLSSLFLLSGVVAYQIGYNMTH